jgi:deazaflavin-dependent oxidoreductase (nitroreductase family)
MAALMWLGEVVDLVSGLRLDRYGIEPRDTDGLLGILAAPFLHAGLAHVAANTVPFLLLGFLIALGGALRVVLVTAIVAIVGGLGTWLFAPAASLHVGASGIVFGYAGFLLSRGFFSRRVRDFELAAVIALVWGGALLGGLLPAAGISWQGHLFGTVGGVVAGWLLGGGAISVHRDPAHRLGAVGPGAREHVAPAKSAHRLQRGLARRVVPAWYRTDLPIPPIRHDAGAKGTAGTGNGRIHAWRSRLKSGRAPIGDKPLLERKQGGRTKARYRLRYRTTGRSQARISTLRGPPGASRGSYHPPYDRRRMPGRLDKRRVATALARYVVNPPVRALFRLGIPAPGTAILETTGRKSGARRWTPVTDGLDGDVFWIVAEHGRRAAYVRNIEADRRVRIKVGRRWRSGSARVVAGDDPRARLRAITRNRRRSTLNAYVVRVMGTDLTTVRVDLDPLALGPGR